MPKNDETCVHDGNPHLKGSLLLGVHTSGISLLFVLFMQSATAQQTVTVTKGIDLEVPTTDIGLKWQQKETTEFYPNKEKYEAEVESLLENPMCLDSNTYVRTTRSSECEINLGVVWKKEETQPSIILRPHEDQRVLEALGTDGKSIGGSY